MTNAVLTLAVPSARPSPGVAYRDELADLADATAYNLANATEDWQRADVLALHRQWAANARRRYRAALIEGLFGPQDRAATGRWR